MNNKFWLFILSFAIVVCFCTSCTRRFPFNGRIPFMLYNDDSTKATKRIEQILATLKNRDKAALKAMFSPRVLEESKTIDEDIDYLFSFFQGEAISFEKPGVNTSESWNRGEKTKSLRYKIDITTSQQRYIGFIVECIEDTVNPEKIGLYTLRIIKAEDKETQFGLWDDMEIAGIYHPVVSTN